MKRVVKIGIWSVAMLLVSLMSTFECMAATPQATPDSVVYSLYFRQGDDLLLKDYRSNEQTINNMAKVLANDGAARILNINIIGSASPEGGLEFNDDLSFRRAESVRSYIKWQWGLTDKHAIQITRQTDYLSAWVRAVESDTNVPRKNKVLEILNTDASVQTKWANIQLLSGGAAQYMTQQIFPELRNAMACVVTFSTAKSASSQALDEITDCDNNIKTATEEQPLNAAASGGTIATTTTVTTSDKTTENDSKTALSIAKPNKPLFALKTNLLFDAATILNLEVEVPIGKRWSIAGEIMFPWWLWDGKQNCLQVMSGTVEGRYWFGDRSRRSTMTGWFAGVHVGGGYYDIEWERKGYQGEFFLAAGVSGGYAHTINKRGNLRMEYSLGVGYLSTNYRHYEAKFSDLDNSWHLYRQSNGQFSWFGPTRAKVSLVWMLDTNLFKNRGGRK